MGVGGLDRRQKKELLARLEADALRICARFRVRYRVLEAERANVKRRYGVCFSDGTIRIRLRHATTGKPLKYSSLVNTLCHELAHLRHFNHGPGFQLFYAEILEWARREGLYQPSRPNAATEQTRPARSPISTQIPTQSVGLVSLRAGEPASNASPKVRPKVRPGDQLELFG
jgi:hypothetical protein